MASNIREIGDRLSSSHGPTGFVSYLRDRSVPWMSRIKLVRYLWNNDIVAALHNRQQFLLDVVSTALSARKRENSITDDQLALWRCLDEMLRSVVQLNASSIPQASSCFVKSVVIQSLLDHLESHSRVECDRRLDDIVMSCAHTLVTSSGESFSQISKFENMLRLLTATVTIAAERTIGKAADTEINGIVSLMKESLPIYSSAQRQKAPAHQVMLQVSRKLFFPSMRWIWMIETSAALPGQELSEVVRSCIDGLREVLAAALFHKDLIQYYELYFRVKLQDSQIKLQQKETKVDGKTLKSENTSTLPKFIEGFFDQLCEQLLVEDTKLSTMHCLPWILQQITNSYRNQSEQLPFACLQYLCRDILCICFESSDCATSSLSTSVSTSGRLNGLSSLLKAVYNLDLYDPRTDEDEKLLAWFTSVVDWILAVGSTRCSSLYECFRWLLLLTPSSTDKKFVQILTTVWTNDNASPDTAEESQDTLLTEIVGTYSKLSRIDKLISRMMDSAKLMTDTTASFRTNFVSSLRQCFSSLSHQTAVNIWSSLNKELGNDFNLRRGDGSLVGFDVVCHVFAVFLRNVCITDLLRKESDVKRLESLYSSVLCSVIARLSDDSTLSGMRSTVDTSSLLMLLFACGELRLVIPSGSTAHISNYALSDSSAPLIDNQFADLSRLYPGLQEEHCLRLHQMVQGKHDWSLLYLWERLLCQQLKVHCLMSSRGNNVSCQHLIQLCDFFVKDKLDGPDTLTSHCWDGQIRTLTANTYSVALWLLISNHLFFILEVEQSRFVSDSRDTSAMKFDEIISNFIIRSLAANEPVIDLSDGGLTLREVTLRFLNDENTHRFHAMTQLHTSLLTAVLRTVATLLQASTLHSPSKKARKSHGMDIDATFASCTSELLVFLANLSLEQSRESLNTEMLNKVTGLLVHRPVDVHVDWKKWTAIDKTMQVLLHLPLLYVGAADQFRCLVFALLLLPLVPVAVTETTLQENNLGRPTLRMNAEAKKVDINPRRSCLRILQLATRNGHGGLKALLSSIDAGKIVSLLCNLRNEIATNNSGESSESVEYCTDALRVTLVHGFTDLGSIELLSHFTNATIFDLNSRRLRHQGNSDDVANTSSFRNLVITMEIIAKVLQRHSLSAEVRSALISIGDSLLSQFYLCFKDWEADNSTTDPTIWTDDTSTNSANQIFVHLTSACSCMLEQLMSERLKGGGGKDDNDDDGKDGSPAKKKQKLVNEVTEKKKKLLTCLPKLCAVCLQCLRYSKDESAIRTCLRFVRIISSSTSDLQLSDGILPKDFFSAVWTLLYDRVRYTRSLGDSLLSDPSDNSARNSADYMHTASTVLNSLDSSEFDTNLRLLLLDMETHHVPSEPYRAIIALETWQHVVDYGLRNDVIDNFYYLCQKVLLLVQQLLMEFPDRSNIVVSALRTQTKLVAFSSTFLSAQDMSVCLHSLSYAPLETCGQSVSEFSTVHCAAYELLNTMLMGRVDVISKMVPAYVAAVKCLLLAVMDRGQQKSNVALTGDHLDELKSAAQRVDRLTGLMYDHKIDFAKVAPYIVAEYMNKAQTLTLYPIVKRALLFAVYRLLDICNEHSIAQLSTVLSPGAKEIFKVIYNDYQNYYRYKGKA